MAGMSRDEKRAHWQGVIEAWEESGLSKAAFCRERGVPVWQLHYWCRRLAEAEAEAATEGFAQVAEAEAEAAAGGFAQVNEAVVAGSGVRLRISGALTVELDVGFDHSTLRRLLAAVGGC